MKLTMFLALERGFKIFLNLCKNMARKINPLVLVVEHQTLWQSNLNKFKCSLIHPISSSCQACGLENSWREMVTPHQQPLHTAISSSINTALSARKQLRKSKTLTSERRSAQLKERARRACNSSISFLTSCTITALALSYHLYNEVPTRGAATRMCPQVTLVRNHLYYTLNLGLAAGLTSLPSRLECCLPAKDRNVRRRSVLETAAAVRGVNDQTYCNLGITRQLFHSIGIGGHSTILLGGGLIAR
ncbi:hypothetical protein M9H77_13309 [Catharanthus roseus]|uniref:Uncharacterized protein n=1 Tax=Catharanthus roseus TaxID=4058 RepID=A0ACC0BJZ2_CATRO|nr:hypothetical protein M9H77_13309 [Catharanthus roseus]